MAAPNSQNVSVAKPLASGTVFVQPVGGSLPTDAVSALPSTAVCLGLITEDGITNGLSSETDKINSFGGLPALTIVKGTEDTFKFTLMETNPDVLKEVYGQDNVTVDSNGTISVAHTGDDLPRRTWFIEVLMTGNRVKRTVIPLGQITERGDVVYQAGEAIGYEVTVSAFPDSHNALAYEYIAALAVK